MATVMNAVTILYVTYVNSLISYIREFFYYGATAQWAKALSRIHDHIQTHHTR